jgi:hypothetical protein
VIFVWTRQASFAKQERPNQASRACRQSEPPRLKHSFRPAILASRTTSDTVGSYIDASDMYHTCNLCLRMREAHGKSAWSTRLRGQRSLAAIMSPGTWPWYHLHRWARSTTRVTLDIRSINVGVLQLRKALHSSGRRGTIRPVYQHPNQSSVPAGTTSEEPPLRRRPQSQPSASSSFNKYCRRLRATVA